MARVLIKFDKPSPSKVERARRNAGTESSANDKFGDKGKSEGPTRTVGELAIRAKIYDFYIRKYAILDLKKIAENGGNIEPARHILIEIRDEDYRQACIDAAKEALAAADKVNDRKYEEYIAKNKKKLSDLGDQQDVIELMKLSEKSFSEWDNSEDAIYDNL